MVQIDQGGSSSLGAGRIHFRMFIVLLLLLGCVDSAFAKKLFRPREIEPDPNCWYNGCWKTGDNLLIGGWTWADCNKNSGYVGTIAHGSVCDGAAAEATQYITFYVPESRYITFRAKIWRQGGAVIQGAAAFGGTQKVWIIDGVHHKTDIDPPWGWDRAISLVMDVALAVCDVSAPCKAVKDVMKGALTFNNAMGLFLSLYHAGLCEHVTIEKHFYATEGPHTVAVGLRSTVSGCSWDRADALNHGVVEEILVWGIGQPEPPTIEGPTEGCPGGYYDFTVYCDDCTGQSLDEVSYLIDWDDDDVDGPTNPEWCGKPVTRTHHWREPGQYTIQVFVQDREDYTWSVATTHTITITEADPNGRPDPVYATEGKYCDHIDITWKAVEGAEAYILYRDFLYHPLEYPPEVSEYEIYRGPALSYSDYDIHVDPVAADTKYWVRAYSGCGYVTSDSDPNANGQQSVTGYARRPCEAPTNVNVTDWVCGPLTITWDPVMDFPGFHDYGMASEYIIYRSAEDDPATAEEIGRTYCTNCTEFTDEPPTAGDYEWYYYWVRAVSDCNPDGSGFSASDCGRRRPVNADPPGNVTASDGTACRWVKIEWRKVTGIYQYNVYRDGELIYGPRDRDYYFDSNAVPGVIYTYAVEAFGDPDCNDMCPSASDTGYVPAIPPTPMGVQATDGIPCDVVVTWQPVSGAAEYRIYRDGSYRETVSGATTSWIDELAWEEGKVYTYHVTSSNGCRQSAPSEPDTGFSGHDISGYIVSSPQASDGSDCDKVHIEWSGGLPSGCWYSLWRSANSSSAAKYKIADHLTVGEYDDYAAEPGVTYRYYLKGESICSRSALGSYNTGKVAPKVAQPAGVIASYAVDCNWIRIEWDSIANWDYYEVWRSDSEDVNGAALLVSNLGTNRHDDITAERGRDYYYWVRARYGPCFGPCSAPAAAGRLADDSDTDGHCDAEDNCPYAFNPGQANCCDPRDADNDADGVSDECDNCPNHDNPFQGNLDGDRFGDRCECAAANFDNVFPIDLNDLEILADEWLLTDANAMISDIHVDGHVDGRDYADWARYWRSDCQPVCECVDEDRDHYASVVTECCVLKRPDCNDSDPGTNPGAGETCDGKDNNCDGQTDEAGAIGCTVYYYNGDGDEFGVTSDSRCLCGPRGLYTATEPNDCDDGNPNAYPGAVETCDGADNDCNGLVDEPGATNCRTYYLDEDRDGYGVAEYSICLCNPFDRFTSRKAGDCNDMDSAVNPGKVENCHDGRDNDCDGLTDFDDTDCSEPPPCWMSPTQCHGDTNNDGILNPLDLGALMAAWQTAYPAPAYDPCADFNRDGRVYVDDLSILIAWWHTRPNPPYPDVPQDCAPGGIWPPR